VKVKFHTFLNAVIVGDEWSAFCVAAVIVGKMALYSLYPRDIQEMVVERLSFTVTESQSNS
jgi:hypothetical protein